MDCPGKRVSYPPSLAHCPPGQGSAAQRSHQSRILCPGIPRLGQHHRHNGRWPDDLRTTVPPRPGRGRLRDTGRSLRAGRDPGGGRPPRTARGAPPESTASPTSTWKPQRTSRCTCSTRTRYSASCVRGGSSKPRCSAPSGNILPKRHRLRQSELQAAA